MTYKNQSGFSLVELAISVMVIGILIGGVVKGREVVDSARILSIMSQVRGYEKALVSFEDVYMALPGDIKTATTDIPGCTSANNCISGNGNSLIGNDSLTKALGISLANDTETIQAWKHLALAGLITSVDATASYSVSDLEWGKTHPKALNGGMEIFYAPEFFTETTSDNKVGHTIRLARSSLSTDTRTEEDGRALLTPMQAKTIDRKFDDGWPITGAIMSWGIGALGCDNMADNSRGYDVSLNGKSCTSFIVIE